MKWVNNFDTETACVRTLENVPDDVVQRGSVEKDVVSAVQMVHDPVN